MDSLITYKLHMGNYSFSIPMGFMINIKEKNVFKAKASERDGAALLMIRILDKGTADYGFEKSFFDGFVNSECIEKIECNNTEIGKHEGLLSKYLLDFSGAPMECWVFKYSEDICDDCVCVGLAQSNSAASNYYNIFVKIIDSLLCKKKTDKDSQYSNPAEKKSALIHGMLKYSDNLSKETYQTFLANPDVTADALLEKTIIRIEGLGLEKRTCNILMNAGILSVNELLELSKNDVLNLGNMGAKSTEQVEKRLDEVGLSLKTPEAERAAMSVTRYIRLEELRISEKEKAFFEEKNISYVRELADVRWQYYAEKLGKESLERLQKKLKQKGTPFCYYSSVHEALFHERQRHHKMILELLKFADRELTDEEYKDLVLRKDASVKDVLKSVLVDIDALDLGVREYRCLNRSNITTINELLNMTEESVRTTRNMGRKSTEKIVRSLAEMDLVLKTPEEICLEAEQKQRSNEMEMINALQDGGQVAISRCQEYFIDSLPWDKKVDWSDISIYEIDAYPKATWIFGMLKIKNISECREDFFSKIVECNKFRETPLHPRLIRLGVSSLRKYMETYECEEDPNGVPSGTEAVDGLSIDDLELSVREFNKGMRSAGMGSSTRPMPRCLYGDKDENVYMNNLREGKNEGLLKLIQGHEEDMLYIGNLRVYELIGNLWNYGNRGMDQDIRRIDDYKVAIYLSEQFGMDGPFTFEVGGRQKRAEIKELIKHVLIDHGVSQKVIEDLCNLDFKSASQFY